MMSLRMAPLLLSLSAPAWAGPETVVDTDLEAAVGGMMEEIGDAMEGMAREVDRELAKAEREAAAEGDVETLEGIREGREAMVDVVRELREELREMKSELNEIKAETEHERIQIEAEIPFDELEARSLGSLREFSDDVVVQKDMVVDQVEAFSGDIEVLGVVRHDAKTFSGDVIIREGGKVLGDAKTLSGDIVVDPGGLLEGVADTFSGDLVVRPGGMLSGAPMVHSVEEAHDGSGWGIASFFGGLFQRLVFLLAFAGAGVLVVALFPDRVRNVAVALEQRPARAGLLGLAWTAGIVVASILFFWTVLGPLVGMAVLGVAWMLGFVGLCQMLGDRLPFSYKPHGRWLAFLVGSVLMSFLGALPWIGLLTVLAASVFGIGAVFVSRFGSAAEA